MKKFWLFPLMIIFLASALWPYSQTVTPQSTHFTKKAFQVSSRMSVVADTNFVLQTIQNNIHWCTGIKDGEYYVFAAGIPHNDSVSELFNYRYETLFARNSWNGITTVDHHWQDTLGELSNLSNDVRWFPVGTDSIALVIATPDSVVIYKKLAICATGYDKGIFNRRSYAFHFDSLQYGKIVGDTLIHVLPNSNGWSITGNSLTKADSIITITGVDLMQEVPEADYKGNLWFYGHILNDTVLMKYEKVSKSCLYYSYNVKNARFLYRDLTNSNCIGTIGHKYSISFATFWFNSKIQAAIAFTDTQRIWYKITSYSSHPNFFYGPNNFCAADQNEYSTDDGLLYYDVPVYHDFRNTRTTQYGSNRLVGRLITKGNMTTYLSCGVSSNEYHSVFDAPTKIVFKDSTGNEKDSMTFRFYALYFPLQFVSMSDSVLRKYYYYPKDTGAAFIYPDPIYNDTTIRTNSSYNLNLKLLWYYGLKTEIISKPSWLTLTNLSKPYTPYMSDTVNGLITWLRSFHTPIGKYTLSGTAPSTGRKDTIKIVFIDTMPIYNGIKSQDTVSMVTFQSCTLSYIITVQPTTTVKQSADIPAENFIKVSESQIHYGLKSSAKVSILVCDLKGKTLQRIETIGKAGFSTVNIPKSNSIMLYRIVVGEKRSSGRIRQEF